MGDSVDLMGPQGDLRVHTRKADMTAVILTGPDRINGFVEDAAQPPKSRAVSKMRMYFIIGCSRPFSYML